MPILLWLQSPKAMIRGGAAAARLVHPRRAKWKGGAAVVEVPYYVDGRDLAECMRGHPKEVFGRVRATGTRARTPRDMVFSWPAVSPFVRSFGLEPRLVRVDLVSSRVDYDAAADASAECRGAAA